MKLLEKFSLITSQISKIKIYVDALSHFNKTIPLYSRKKDQSFCWELIINSLLAGEILLKDNDSSLIADIGAGSGFPGCVLAILDPVRDFWLFEPHKKKADFLEHIIWKMDLKNTQIKNIPIQQSEQLLDCAVSKAFLSLGERLNLTKSVFRPRASYYHLQSVNWREQWLQSSEEVKGFWKIEPVKQYSVLGVKRILVKTILIK